MGDAKNEPGQGSCVIGYWTIMELSEKHTYGVIWSAWRLGYCSRRCIARSDVDGEARKVREVKYVQSARPHLFDGLISSGVRGIECRYWS